MLRHSRAYDRPPFFHAPTLRPNAVPSLLLAALGVAWSVAAVAATGDTVQPFVFASYTHEDNLFLLPDNVPGFVGPRDDNSRQMLAGIKVRRPLGRQVFDMQAKVSSVKFDHYGSLNYSGLDFSGGWEWHLASHLQGHLGATYTQSLSSFADYHGQERDLRSDRRVFADGEWRFHPSWRLHAGVSQQRVNYDLDVRRVNDRRESAREAGIDLLAASDNSIGILVRHIDGDYPHPARFGSVVIQDGYGQDEVKANVSWKLGGLTQVQFLGGWARRRHESAQYRDASGVNGRGNIYWQPLGKLRFTLTGWREFAALESLVATSSLNKGASLSANYDLSSKMQLQASRRSERRQFIQISGLPFTADGRDSTQLSSVGLIYAPLPAVQINVNARRASRSGLQLAGTSPYRSNSMSFSLAAEF